MNKENKKGNNTFVILGLMLLIAVILCFIMLYIINNTEKVTPIDIKATTTTEAVENKPEERELVPFSASLKEILFEENIMFEYKVETYYSGYKFNITCSRYNTEEGKCSQGSGMMSYNDVVLTLYTFEDDEDDYLDHLEDYYIIVDNSHVVLLNNKVGHSGGSARIYNYDGSYVGEVKNAMTGYNLGDRVINELYPSITDNSLYLYVCDSGNVRISSVSFDDVDAIGIEDTVSQATCY